MPKKQAPRKQGGQALWWVAGAAVVVVGGLIAISTLGAKQEPAAVTVSATSDAEVHANRSLKGPATAKVKLVEFGDFL